MRIVALVSGSGTNLQAVLDAVASGALPVEIAAVGSDVPGVQGLARAEAQGIETFTVSPRDYADRRTWDEALAEAVASYEPDWVVCSGFMRILGAPLLERFEGRIINTHPALLPSFPGAHGVRDALAYGVKVTGCTVHLVDAGVDTGPILAQTAVPVLVEDTEEVLHERIKVQERALLLQVLGELAARS
ncbi:phosphoribosylglycinamide formyltransferase [Micrococcus sp.]|uniref:phosphoribosylglycinamide formyltransferase n=1 Tax=Micrococcus sp. TaxID=1271 RepID=UPI002A91F9D8|nr:phosphoribosylglycinamide formyltransferase [Micrococcus sp.]MDY6055742.1 phosphoribosylglycinamide formyltransferase [Micrococcus sp.]